MAERQSLSPWWFGKSLFAFGLLGLFIVSGIYGYWRTGLFFWLGRVCIFSGSALSMYHFYKMKKLAGSLCHPQKLVTDFGMLRWIRHPMYLGELIVVWGFALTIATPLTAIPFVFYFWFITLLCQDEDLDNAEDFPAEFEAWRQRTKRLFPFIW